MRASGASRRASAKSARNSARLAGNRARLSAPAPDRSRLWKWIRIFRPRADS